MLPIDASRRPFSFTTGDLNDLDGVKTSAATSTSPVVFSGAQLNGAFMNAVQAFKKRPRSVTVSSSSQAAQYNTTNPIVVTGKRGGVTVTENLQLTQANGNETIRGKQPFDSIDSISIPAQVGTSGALQFGVGDIWGLPGDVACRSLRATADGNVNGRWGQEPAGTNPAAGASDLDESIPVLSGLIDGLAPTVIFTSQALTAPTNVGLVLYT